MGFNICHLSWLEGLVLLLLSAWKPVPPQRRKKQGCSMPLSAAWTGVLTGTAPLVHRWSIEKRFENESFAISLLQAQDDGLEELNLVKVVQGLDDVLGEKAQCSIPLQVRNRFPGRQLNDIAIWCHIKWFGGLGVCEDMEQLRDWNIFPKKPGVWKQDLRFEQHLLQSKRSATRPLVRPGCSKSADPLWTTSRSPRYHPPEVTQVTVHQMMWF